MKWFKLCKGGEGGGTLCSGCFWLGFVGVITFTRTFFECVHLISVVNLP